jgi:tRNA(Ile)-lysidine synthase
VVEQGTHKPLAGGSNPPSATTSSPLDRLAAAVARGTDAIPDDGTLILAVSGGPDSTALLHGAARLVSTGHRPWTLVVAHVDHQLRPDSGSDAVHVAAMARSLGLACELRRADVAATARAEHRSLEDTGRLVRYRFLEELAGSLGDRAWIVTGHTADDVAETMLLRMARGSGLRGLRGIPPRRGRIVRPLLHARRRDLRQALDEAGIGYVLDPTNDDPAAADRNLVRAEILPALERLNPRVVEAFQRLARLAADDDDALDAVAAAELRRRRGEDGIDWRHPPSRAIGRRVMRLAVGEPAPSAERIEALLDAAEGPRGGLTVELGEGRGASVRERRITLHRIQD